MRYNLKVPFEELKGKTLVKVEGLNIGNDIITFICEDNSQYTMFHSQDCCESVSIEDIIGNVEDIIGSELLIAEERQSEDSPELNPRVYRDELEVWTFYELATIKGSLTIRWYGTSNGYYSVDVSFWRMAR